MKGKLGVAGQTGSLSLTLKLRRESPHGPPPSVKGKTEEPAVTGFRWGGERITFPSTQCPPSWMSSHAVKESNLEEGKKEGEVDNGGGKRDSGTLNLM